MNWFTKIKAVAVYVFGGFESAADYVLKIVLDAVGTKNLEKASSVAKWANEWLVKLSPYCPEPWRKYYQAVADIVDKLDSILRDSDVSVDEVSDLIKQFREAYAEWMAD